MSSPFAFTEVLPGSARRVASRARRADRVPALFGLRRDANQSLDDLVAMIVGVGAVGATTALSLARLQVGELRLVDQGCFKPASLPTQPITPDLIGQPKATAIARLCKEISPRTRVLAFDGPLQDLALADMAGVNVLVVAGDNLTVLRDTGQRCLNLGIKMIHAAVHGESLTAQCRTYSHATADSPCPVCLFGAEEFRMMDEERVFSCEGSRAGAGPKSRSLQPTMSLRPLSALCGETAAMQVTRLALALGSDAGDSLLEICAYTWRSLVTQIRRNPACPCAHERYAIQPAPRTLSDCTLAELVRAARLATASEPECARPRAQKHRKKVEPWDHRKPPAMGKLLRPGTGALRQPDEPEGFGKFASLSLEGFPWAERGLCACAESRPLDRFIRLGHPAGRCARCHQPIHPQPFHTHDAIPAASMERFGQRTLRSLGAKDCRGVLARHGERTVLLTNPNPPSHP